MEGRFLVVLLLALDLVLTEVTWRPLSGQLPGYVQIQAVDIQDVPNIGGRVVSVSYTATSTTHVLWQVDGKEVMHFDTNFATMSGQNSASLRLVRVDPDTSVMATIILPAYQESVYFRVGEVTPGRYTISNHTLHVTPKEAVTYAQEDIGDFHVDAVMWVGGDSLASNLRLHSMMIMPDYCSRPVRPLVGVHSSVPTMIEAVRGRTDWIGSLSPGQTAAERVNLVSVSRPTGSRGMLAVSSTFSPPTSPIKSVHTVQRTFFKPAIVNSDFIERNTVMFFGWQNDVVVDKHEDADLHVYALGNPTPRITLAKNGTDLSLTVDRLDIEEAYYKHTIFRFRNATTASSGRYICTAQSGSGRIKETFTLSVRSTC
ncbi:uncharacterized protein LOC124142813 [Haliotis rufescens]|uniref:uncharacterized protein LOC124142813 n=1 Tax=Haliotis rufescens TaxID=6454 RepID=UPI00201F1DF0|nr:uncharacterized protein LOC124142813 [Haliotis rufescens]